MKIQKKIVSADWNNKKVFLGGYIDVGNMFFNYASSFHFDASDDGVFLSYDDEDDDATISIDFVRDKDFQSLDDVLNHYKLSSEPVGRVHINDDYWALVEKKYSNGFCEQFYFIQKDDGFYIVSFYSNRDIEDIAKATMKSIRFKD